MTSVPAQGFQLPRLRVDRDGDWFDDGVEVTHPGVLASLRRGLRRDARGYFIEDAPFVATRLERRGAALHVILNDGSEEDVDAATLRIGTGDVPYCAVKGGAFEARLSRAAAHQLLALAEWDEATGQGTLRLDGSAYALRRGA